MDPDGFDRATRRATLAFGASGLATLLGLEEVDGKRKKKKKKVKVCLRGQTLTVSKKQQNQFLLGGATLGACPGPTCTDGIKNGNETGVDCGGSCPKCADGQPCARSTDCISGTCFPDASSPTGRTCQVCPNFNIPCGPNCSCEAVTGQALPICVSIDERDATQCDAACTGDRFCSPQFGACFPRCTT